MSYNKTVWHTGDTVHADQLNNIEEGIKKVDQKLEGIENGAQVNKIEGIQFNGSDLTPDTETKKVNISAAPYNQAVPLPQQNDEGKILGYEAPTEGARPIVGWVEKPSNGVTPHIDQTTKHWMIGEEDTEVDAEGKSAYQVYVASVPQGETPMTEAQWLASLKGEKGDNAINPFKGWVNDVSDLPANPHVGDYAYIKDNDTTYVYRCTTEGEWPSTSAEEKEPSDATFASAQLLNNVKIDNTHLVNPVGNDETNAPTLAKAEDVMQLKAKLEGVTASEAKVNAVVGTNVTTGKYINGTTTGLPTSPSSDSPNYAYIEVAIPQGTKSIRFLAGTKPSSYSMGYSVGYYNENTYVPTRMFAFDSESSPTTLIEKVIELQEGETVFMTTCSAPSTSSLISLANFYCYLQSGDSVVELIPEIVTNFTTESETKALSAKAGKDFHEDVYGYDEVELGDNIAPSLNNTGWTMASYTEDTSAIAFHFNSSINYGYSFDVTNYRGKRILIKAKNSYNCILAVTTEVLNSSTVGYNPTLGDLTNEEDPVLCRDVHYVNGTWFNSITIPSGEEVYITIPLDASRIYFAGRTWVTGSNYETVGNDINARLPSVVKIETVTHVDGDIDNIEKDIEELQGIEGTVNAMSEEIYGTDVEEEINGISIATTLKMSMDKNVLYVWSKTDKHKQRAYEIPISGFTTLEITPNLLSAFFFISKEKIQYKEQTLTGSTVASTYIDTGCDGYQPNGSSLYRMSIYPSGSESSPSGKQVITLSENAKYLYIQKNFSDATVDYTPSVVLKRTKKEGGLVDLLNDKSQNIAGTSLLSLTSGYMAGDGTWVDDNRFMMTSPIPLSHGVFLEVFPKYRVHSAMMYDNNGNIVNKRDLYGNLESNLGANITCYQKAKIFPQYYVRVRISDKDGESIDANTKVVKKFAYIDDRRLVRKLPNNNEIIEATSGEFSDDYDIELAFPKVQKRYLTLSQVLYEPLLNLNMPIGTSPDNINYGKQGDMASGIVYSETAEYTKYVGMHVSLKTFLTALQNKRSVMYTEAISSADNTSKYGIAYHGLQTLSNPYYGTVCSGFVCYNLDFNDIKFSGSLSNYGVTMAYGNHDNPYPSTDPFDIIQPLDLVWYTGHVMMVTDVYTDDFGNSKLIVISESTVPFVNSRPYDRDGFKKRMVDKVNTNTGTTENPAYTNEWKLLRYTAWNANIEEPENTPFVQRDWMEYQPDEIEHIDDDITTFAGEYAAFSIGDPSDSVNNNKMFLNIHRGGSTGYTHLQIFNETADESTAEPLYDIDISSNGGNVVQATSYTNYTEDAADKEDWIVFNIGNYWYNNSLSSGKYKARVVRKESGVIVEEMVSGCTHFQMVDITFNITKDSNSITVGFSSSEGIPYLIRQEKPDGMSNKIYELTDTDISTGSKMLLWTGFSTYKYVKLFVKADYGVVVKRIDMSI